jgi:hypothetical protein
LHRLVSIFRTCGGNGNALAAARKDRRRVQQLAWMRMPLRGAFAGFGTFHSLLVVTVGGKAEGEKEESSDDSDDEEAKRIIEPKEQAALGSAPPPPPPPPPPSTPPPFPVAELAEGAEEETAKEADDRYVIEKLDSKK